MSRIVKLISVLVLVWCMLNTSAGDEQVSCVNAPTMQNVNTSQLVGTWFEAARYPNVTDMGCIEIDLGLHPDNNSSLDINVTYVDPLSVLFENTTLTANITLNATNNDGYNVSFSLGTKSQPSKILKLLGTDYNNYAFICGYTNASDESTAFSAVLTRLRISNATALDSYKQLANKTYTNFSNMTDILQSEKCYRSGASTSLPMIASAFAVILVLLKYVY